MASPRRTWCSLIVLLLVSLLLAHSFMSVAGEDEVEDIGVGGEGGEVGLVDERISDVTADDILGSATGVESVFYFPKNPQKTLTAGEPAEILVGISNNGEAPLKVVLIRASLHLPFDHRMFVQNFTAQEFESATVPPAIQASFSYPFTVNKYLQPGSFDLVASVVYEVEEQLHRTVFYNGTVEVVEASGFLSGETVFLVTLGLGLLGLLGMWMYSQFQQLSKKTRRSKKVETGTRGTVDASNSEWLQGTSFTQKLSRSTSQPTKSKKKK